MYNSNFICTYNFYDKTLAIMNPVSIQYFEEKKNDLEDEGVEEDVEMADFIYKNELLYAFNLEEYNEYIVNNKITELYNNIIVNNDYNLNVDYTTILKQLIDKLTTQLLSDNLETGFIVLFSYTYFHIIHLCLCDLFNKGSITDLNINAIKNILDKLDKLDNL